MRQLIGPTIFMLTALFLCASLSLADDKELLGLEHGHTEKVKIVVPGDKDWVDTGIVLAPGDSATIVAEGTVHFNPVLMSDVSPQGYKREHYESDYVMADYQYCGDPYEQFSHAALIGEVNGDVFYVGPKKVITGKNGKLYLGINDCSLDSPEEYKNSGQFVAVIIVDRHEKPLKP